MFSSLFVTFILSASALATVFVTEPVGSTTFNGGQQATVTWKDDGNAPSLQAFGPAIVAIYVGNAQQQTSLQTISSSVDVSTTASIVFTVDPTIGPNSGEYFIRFQSISLKDPKQVMYPAEAFSSKFTLAGMTGTFNSTVQSQIDGQTTAPIGGTATPAATTAAHTTAAVTTASVTASKSGSASPSASKVSNTNGALGRSPVSIVAVGAVAALFGVALL